nr:hypothetical protein [Tanacetum cinerariifolium]
MPLKKKAQISLDEELSFKIQVEEDEQERIIREIAQHIKEVNLAWDDFQAKVDAYYKLAERLQAEEQEQLTDAKKAILFMELMEKRRKFFAAKRAEEKRNKPPTKAQQRSLMSTYLKNMDGWKTRALKTKSFAEIQDLFNKAMKRKVENDKEKEELKKCLEIIPDDRDDVITDATPLSTKSLTIVDYKIYKKRRKSFFQIFRAYGNSQMHLTFSKLLKNFDREDLEVLWRLVKDRFVKTKPVDDMDSFLMHTSKTMFEHHVEDTIVKDIFKESQPKEVLDVFLWHTLKVMFEHSVEDSVWKHQKGPKGLARVKNWKLFDSCEVNCVTLDTIQLYLLAEKISSSKKEHDDILKEHGWIQDGIFEGMSYEEIRPLFEEEYNKVQTLFKEGPKMDAKKIKAPRKRIRKEEVEKDQTAKKQKGDELEKENAEKQKLVKQQEAEELKKNSEIVPGDKDDVFVNVARLSSKPSTIMDYKIYKEGKNEHF